MATEHQDIFTQRVSSHRRALADTEVACRNGMSKLCAVCARALESGRRILFFGNGGSAADAQHIAAELSVRFNKNRRALAGMALTTDSSVLTACANDFGFEHIFSRQIEAFGQAGDVAIGLSTSGNSANVIAGLECATRKGLLAAALTGGDGGRLQGVADPLIIVPSEETATIQEMHILLGHILCAEIEQRLAIHE